MTCKNKIEMKSRNYEPDENNDFGGFDKSYHLMPNGHAHFIISGGIYTSEKWYNPLLHALYQADTDKVINIKMSTHGGDSFAMDVLISALQDASSRGAKIVVDIAGKCMSAGTYIVGALIGLKNVDIIISKNTAFLFHLGYLWHGGNVIDTNEFSNFFTEHSKELANTFLTPMLSKEEMDKVLSGRDVLLDGAVISNRIMDFVKRQKEYFAKRDKERDEEMKREKELFDQWRAEREAKLEKQTKAKKPSQSKNVDKKEEANKETE